MIHISLGENCFTEYNLKYYRLTTRTSSVFSYMGSNIKLILRAIKDDFKNFLVNRSFYEDEKSKFSFLHYNLENKKTLSSFERKIKRFQSEIKNHKVVFWYHYRNKNILSMIEVIECFKEFDKIIGANAEYVILTQITDAKNKGFENIKISKFNIIKCYDSNPWIANNYQGNTFRKYFDQIFNRKYFNQIFNKFS